jgi:hypothetical protein
MYYVGLIKFIIAVYIEVLSIMYMIYQVSTVNIVFSFVTMMAIMQIDFYLYLAMPASETFPAILKKKKKDMP